MTDFQLTSGDQKSMYSLKNVLGIDGKISPVAEAQLKDVICQIYNAKFPQFRFIQNSELIDINNKFRIFMFNNIPMISKKTSFVDAENERNLSLKAHSILNDISLKSGKICIVVPTVINKCAKESFLISEYFGCTMHEELYSKRKTEFGIDDFFELIKFLFEKGVMHRGLVPRNIIRLVSGDLILIDWEDAKFDVKQDHRRFNRLWYFNLIINWGDYYFNKNDLKKELLKYVVRTDNYPPLLPYEKKFVHLMGIKRDISNTRDIIEYIVLGAEAPIKNPMSQFYIMPNDIVRLISDLFPVIFDVLFDIAAFVMRKSDESMYIKYLIKMTNIITSAYMNNQTISSRLFPTIIFFFCGYEINHEEDASFCNSMDFKYIANNIANTIFDLIGIMNLSAEPSHTIIQSIEECLISVYNEVRLEDIQRCLNNKI